MEEATIINRFLNRQELNLTVGKEIVRKFNEHLTKQFYYGTDILTLTNRRCLFIDLLLKRLYKQFNLEEYPDLAIVAVGGYGREELHPFTDIDLLILSENTLCDECASRISSFITLLWDCKLDVGHAVRTIDECITDGKADLTIATNLLDARLVHGSQQTFDKLQSRLSDRDYWPIEQFFLSKVQEQEDRHNVYRDTMYSLEPDLKQIPGGMRDIHTIFWIAKKYLGIKELDELTGFGYLTRTELLELKECEYFLWKVRFTLQNYIQRNDNRLTFDRQINVSKVLGYLGDGNVPVENFMSTFYFITRRISEINEMVLQFFREAIFSNHNSRKLNVINSKFVTRDDLIDTIDPTIFNDPVEILNLFLSITELSEKNSQIKIVGIYPSCVRNIRTAKRNLKGFLQNDPRAREIFLKIISNPNSMRLAFKLMHKYSILSIYLPQWPNLVGQMQFDMFHTYTVDEHIYRTMKYIFDVSHNESRDNSEQLFKNIYNNLPKHSLLYISALFHDVAKGRHNGRHHAEEGSVDAMDFCRLHKLPISDCRLVSWLVLNHLEFSKTALRRDIYDPIVVQDFAELIKDEIHLNYLYCLTVADICATNDTEWNSWKQALFRELYFSTLQAIRLGPEHSIDWSQTIKDNQEEALTELCRAGIKKERVLALWKNFKDQYFIKNSGNQIFWHTNNILAYDPATNVPLVLFGQSTNKIGTELFIYTRDYTGIFCRIVSILVSKGISILEASIMNSKDNFIMDTFILVDRQGRSLSHDKIVPLQKILLMGLINTEHPLPKPVPLSKKFQQFKIKSVVQFLDIKGADENGVTHVEISTLDRPGLLALISSVFQKCRININAARIATTGERADDGFSISNHQGKALSQEEKGHLQTQMLEALHRLDEQN